MVYFLHSFTDVQLLLLVVFRFCLSCFAFACRVSLLLRSNGAFAIQRSSQAKIEVIGKGSLYLIMFTLSLTLLFYRRFCLL